MSVRKMDKINPPLKVYQNRKKMALPKTVLAKPNTKPQRHISTLRPAASPETETKTVPPVKVRPATATRRPVWSLKDTTKTGIYDGKPEFVKRRRWGHSPPKEIANRLEPFQDHGCESKSKGTAGTAYLLGLRDEKELCQIQSGDEDFFPGFLEAVESSFKDIELECPQFKTDHRSSILKELEVYSKHRSLEGQSKAPPILSDSEESLANLIPNKQHHWIEPNVQGRSGLPCRSDYSDHSSGSSNWPNHLSRPPHRPALVRGADHRHLGMNPKPDSGAEFKLPFNLYAESATKPPYVDPAHYQTRRRVGEPLKPPVTTDWMNQPIASWKPPDHSLYPFPSASHRGVYRTYSNCSSASSDSRRACASTSAGCEPFPNLVNEANCFGNSSSGPYRPTRESRPAYRIDSLASREMYGGAADAYQVVSPLPADSYDVGPYFRPLYSEFNFP